MNSAAEQDQRCIEHSILFPTVHCSHCLRNATFKEAKQILELSLVYPPVSANQALQNFVSQKIYPDHHL